MGGWVINCIEQGWIGIKLYRTGVDGYWVLSNAFPQHTFSNDFFFINFFYASHWIMSLFSMFWCLYYIQIYLYQTKNIF